ncbi:hypothetical protein [Pontibacter beigongshangensis]|uniref:hypothetical protein n=1 Tax=Pontibacter beigongshangensis TaxID=2574733 RepID=UPI00164FBED5|nr:hypothetical protein [Pontibacter beigongshangensis]
MEASVKRQIMGEKLFLRQGLYKNKTGAPATAKAPVFLIGESRNIDFLTFQL